MSKIFARTKSRFIEGRGHPVRDLVRDGVLEQSMKDPVLEKRIKKIFFGERIDRAREQLKKAREPKDIARYEKLIRESELSYKKYSG